MYIYVLLPASPPAGCTDSRPDIAWLACLAGRRHNTTTTTTTTTTATATATATATTTTTTTTHNNNMMNNTNDSVRLRLAGLAGWVGGPERKERMSC